MERSVSVSSDSNIRWSTYFGRNIPTEIRRSIFGKLVLFPNKGIRKRNKNVRTIPIGWPSFIAKCRSSFVESGIPTDL